LEAASTLGSRRTRGNASPLESVIKMEAAQNLDCIPRAVDQYPLVIRMAVCDYHAACYGEQPPRHAVLVYVYVIFPCVYELNSTVYCAEN